MTDIIAEISAASQEQSAGIEEVNRAIIEMDGVTQQNAALVEEAAAAQSLQDQAAELAKVVSVFKLSGNQPATTKYAGLGVAPTLLLTPISAPAKTRLKPALRAVATTPAATSKSATRKLSAVNASSDEWEEF